MDDEVKEEPDETTEQAAVIPPINQRVLPPQDYDLVGFSACSRCVHLISLGTQSGNGWTCRAFPTGIYATTVGGAPGWEHTHELPYDGGFRYAPTVFWTEDGIPYAHDWDGVAFRVDEVVGGGPPKKPKP